MADTKITPFLWFDDDAEEAMNFYCSLLPDTKMDAEGLHRRPRRRGQRRVALRPLAAHRGSPGQALEKLRIRRPMALFGSDPEPSQEGAGRGVFRPTS